MYASTKREFVSSPSTLFGSTVSRPGSNSCCDKSRSDSYIGCGNFGAAMIGSIGTMPVLVGGVAVVFSPIAIDCLCERHERASRFGLRHQRIANVLHRKRWRRREDDADAARIDTREVRLRGRAEVGGSGIVGRLHGLIATRDETPAVLQARYGSAAAAACSESREPQLSPRETATEWPVALHAHG